MPLDVARGIRGRSGPEGQLRGRVRGGLSRGVWKAVHGPRRGAVGWLRNPGGEGHPAGRPLAGPRAWGHAGLHAMPGAVTTVAAQAAGSSPGWEP